jgi:uncharacterized protein (DUF302 family)
MQRDPRVGYELPLRILLWQAGDCALVGYRDPKEPADQYELSQERSLLDRMAALLAELTAEAAS